MGERDERGGSYGGQHMRERGGEGYIREGETEKKGEKERVNGVCLPSNCHG